MNSTETPSAVIAACAHCGGHSVTLFKVGVDGADSQVDMACCDDCSMSGPLTSWQGRAPIQRSAADVLALQTMVMLATLRGSPFATVHLLPVNISKSDVVNRHAIEIEALWTVPAFASQRFEGPTLHAALSAAVAFKQRREVAL